MQLTVKKTVEEEIEVKLPYFFKTWSQHVAILSEDKSICVTVMSGISAVAVFPTASLDVIREEKTEITATEFHEEMLSAINNITVELHNVAALQQNEFIRNENLKSEGY